MRPLVDCWCGARVEELQRHGRNGDRDFQHYPSEVAPGPAEDRDRDNYPKDVRHWREQPPEPRRIGGRTKAEAVGLIFAMASAITDGDVRREHEAMADLDAWLSAAFSEPSR